jgi:hypothetical protein
MGVPVLRLPSSFIHAIAITPVELIGCISLTSPTSIGLLRINAGSASTFTVSRPAQRSLTLRPVCSPNPLRALYIGGFTRFVTSTTAPIATGRSESCRAGFAPAERQRLGTAHVKYGESSGLLLLISSLFNAVDELHASDNLHQALIAS